MTGDTVLTYVCPHCCRAKMTWAHIQACKMFQGLCSSLPHGAKVTVKILKGRDADYYSDK